jgi:APA family basic amino acid/polyamine antiporter
MTTPSSTGTQREIGFWICTALVVGNTIGIGIFMTPAALAPYGLNALIAWLIVVIGCVGVAGVFAGLARLFPQDDGPYSYTVRAFGGGIAFFSVWCYWVSIWVTNATIAIGVVGYLSAVIPALNSGPLVPPVAATILVWVFVLLNLRGVRTVGGLQILTVVLKLVPMLAVMVLGAWELLTSPSAYTQHVPTTPFNVADISAATTIALFAMLGIECGTIPAGRVRDPSRTIPRATIAGTALTALIYISVFVVPLFLIPQDELAKSNAPFADLLSRFLGSGYGQTLALFVVISGLGALNGWTLMAGELTQSFARHGTLPPALGKVNARGMPTRALVLTGAAASVMLLGAGFMQQLHYMNSIADVFAFFSVVVAAANLPLYLFCALAVLVLWRRGEIGGLQRRETFLLFAAVLATLFAIWAFKGAGFLSLVCAIGLGLIGVPVYLWMRRGHRTVAGVRGGA